MKNNNFIIVGSSGGIGTQLVADLAKNNRLLLGYHNEKPNDRLPNTISAPVDARSFDSVASLIELGKSEFEKIDGIVSLPGSVILKPANLVTDDELNSIADSICTLDIFSRTDQSNDTNRRYFFEKLC